MKFIVVIIAIIILLFIFRDPSESFEVNQAIFNQVEIPTDRELQKDPYYQSIKNTDFPCACGEGREKNSRNECAPLCPTGQIRFTDDKCYPPCPTGQTRHTNTVCYPPCPVGEFRNPSGVCQCNIQQPLYDLSINHDIGGFDLGGGCLRNPGGGWPKWGQDAKARCDNNPDCKAYNLIHGGGAWGDAWGSCMKTKSDIPSRVPLNAKIDYYRKIETVKNNNGVCATECPTGKTNVNGICQWNPCPAEKSRDAYGDCQFDPCPTGQSRDGNGVCQCIQQPYYERYPKLDVPNNDISCSWNVPNLEGCKLNCNNNPECKAYNIIDGKHCCLKKTSSTPTASANNIDYFKRVDAPLSKDPDGICRPPCPSEQKRDSNGVCQCPVNKTKDANGVCQCAINTTKAGNGECYPTCTANAIMGYNGECYCKTDYYKQPDGTCKYIKCTGDTYFDQVTQTCKSTDCGPGGFLDPSGPNWVCRCGPGYSMGPSGKCDIVNLNYNAYDILAFNKLLMDSGAG